MVRHKISQCFISNNLLEGKEHQPGSQLYTGVAQFTLAENLALCLEFPHGVRFYYMVKGPTAKEEAFTPLKNDTGVSTV